MTKARIFPSKEYFEKFVAIDETVESGLCWKNTKYSGKYKSVLSTVAGASAGCLTTDNYWRVGIEYKYYPVHRIIMILCGYDINGMVIDHVDGNPRNNKIGNLRLITSRQNSQNRKLDIRSTTSIHGVHRVDLPNGYNSKINEYWHVQWSDISGKVRHKYFSIAKLGYDNAKELAIEFRLARIKELNEDGQNYTERHYEEKV